MDFLVEFWGLRARSLFLTALCSRFYVVNMEDVRKKGIVT